MERMGHLGTALVFCSLLVVWLGPLYGVLATAMALAFDRVPDQDQYIPESVVTHRGQTHTFLFAFVVAFVTASTVAYPIHLGQEGALEYGILSSRIVTPVYVWVFVGGVAAIAMSVHVVTDTLTKGGGFKVTPLWPLSSWSPALGLCRSDNTAWNVGLFASGLTAICAAMVHEIYYTILPLVL